MPYKVLVCHRPGGAFAYISDGWINALNDSGHTAKRWTGNISDWKEFDPDLYIGCSGHRQPIPAQRRAKVAIHVNPYGPIDIPGIMESQDSINWVRSVKADAVFGYAHETDGEMWSYWTLRQGVPFVPMATAGDITLYGDMNTERPVDVVYVGGRWGYKAKTIDSYLFPVLKEHKYKLAGWGDWPSWVGAQSIGDGDVNILFNSGRVAPCISEYHTHTHGIDLPERMWKTTLAGCLPVHDAAKDLRRYLPSVPTADSPKAFSDLIWHYVKNEDERKVLVARLKSELHSGGHTYHHRIAGLLSVLGLDCLAILQRAAKRIES
jgi:hypothetical protein